MLRILVAVLAIVPILTSARVRAHEDNRVGGVQLTVGWLDEPAYSGVPNAVQASVTSVDAGVPVAGAELSVEVILGPADGPTRSGRIALLPISPGEYRAPLIPTTPGTYTFHITGSAGETEVDLRVTSGAGTFDDVQDAAAIKFPAAPGNAGDSDAKLNRVARRVDNLQAGLSGDDGRWGWSLFLGAVGAGMGLSAVALALRAGRLARNR
jgi:hypothetical protein